MVRTISLAVGGLLVAAPLVAQAPRDSAAVDSVRRLAPVVTTATRTPVRADAVARRLDVVDRATIERTAFLDVTDVLKKEAGADVIQFGGLLSGVGLRGFRPQYAGTTVRTLLLVDGRPAGVTNAALLDLGDAERVEVLRGPASALYGSSAMGGVINVVSRRRTDALGGRVQAGVGSFGASELRAEGGGALWRAPDGRQLDADVSVRRVAQTDNYRVGKGNLFRDLVGAEEVTLVDGDRVVGTAEEIGDGVRRANTTFRYDAGQARVGWAFGSGLRLDLRGDVLHADDVESPGNLAFADSPFPGNSRKNVGRWSGDVALTGVVGHHAPLVRAWYAEEASEYYDQPDAGRFVNYVTDVFTRGVQVQDALALGWHSVVAGVDATRTDEDSRRLTTPGVAAPPYVPNAAQQSLAAFAEWRWQALNGRLTGTLGARADRVSLELKETALRPDVQPGTRRFDVVTPSGSVLARLTSALAVRASVGRAFVAPGAFATAGLTRTTDPDDRVAFAAGNPDLDPERSLTVDGGLVVALAEHGLELDAGYFHTRVRDRISPALATFEAGAEPTTPDGARVARVETRVNAASAVMRGVEARLAWDAGAIGWPFRVTASLTRMLEAEERVPAVSVDVARLENAQSFTPEQTLSAVVLGPEARERIDNVARTTVNAGIAWYGLRSVDLRLSGRYVGERRDLDFVSFTSDVIMPPFLTVDVAAGARLHERLRADLLVSNLTDENYYEVRGYNLPGRALSIRLTADF